MQSRTMTIDGTPVRWEEQGEGQPVVLVHGIPTSPALWRHVTPRIPGLRVLAFELTGYGDSIPAGTGREAVARRPGRPAQRPGSSSWAWARSPSSGTTSAAVWSTSPRYDAPTCVPG